MGYEWLKRRIQLVDGCHARMYGFDNRLLMSGRRISCLSRTRFDVYYLPPDTECLCTGLQTYALDMAIKC
jgi:hypothetical protein